MSDFLNNTEDDLLYADEIAGSKDNSTPEKSNVSYLFYPEFKSLGFGLRELKKLDPDMEFAWEDQETAESCFTRRANISKYKEYYRFEAVDTLSECHIWAFGYFAIENNRMIFLKSESGSSDSEIHNLYLSFKEIIKLIVKERGTNE